MFGWKLYINPGWEIWKNGWLGNYDWDLDWGSGRVVGWKFGTDLSWGNQKDFWLERVIMRHSGEHMEVWSGGPKYDVTWSNVRVRAWWMCGSGDGWVQWTGGCSEVPKSRLFDHMHQDARTERWYLLLNIYHKILASATYHWPRGFNMGPPRCACPWLRQSGESASQHLLGWIRVWPRPLDGSRPWWQI